MKLPRRTLILAAVALLGMARTSWGAEPVAGRNYFSVQLLSAKSAGALQESLARVAQQPHARIDQRGADFALRVGLWESRAEAEQGLEAVRQAFRSAYVRTATYSPDSTASAEKPPARTSAPLPAVAAPSPRPPTTAAPSPPRSESAQSQVLSSRRAEQQNVVPNPELQGIKPPPGSIPPGSIPPGSIPPSADPSVQAIKPAPPAGERPRSRAQPAVRTAAAPDEEPLWRRLREERYAELETELSRLRQAYPRWSPPAQLLALKQEAEIRLRITQSIARKDWTAVTALAQQHPGQFVCGQVDFLWGLAEAHHALGNVQQTVAVYQRIIPSCPLTADRIATLQKASTLLTAEAYAALLQREAQAGQRNAGEQAQIDQITYDDRLRRFLQAVQAKDPKRAAGLIGGFEAALRARRDAPNAALAGWVNFDAGQPETAAAWFATALEWQPTLEDARYGLALANFRLNRLDAAEAALRLASAAEPRNRALLGEIAYARALQAYEGKDYRRSLEYLSQADAQGKSGRDSAMLRAWNAYQLGDYPEAARLFTGLYRDQPDSASAEGTVFSLSRSERWDELAELARSLGGPLEEHWKTANAQRHYDRKLFLAAEAAAPGKIAQLHNIAAASIALGAMLRDKSGEDGTSRLRLTKAPFAEGVAVLRDRHEFRLQLDRVTLNSGSLPERAVIGSFPAAGGYVTTPTTRLRNSFEPHLSYRHQGWQTTYAGFGLTPSGAVLSSMLVGNLGVMRQTERGNWRAEIFSQPVRESILSYTGIVDPYTGQNWGRVRRSGALLGGYSALTERWSASGQLQAMHLEGRNVAGNQGLTLNLGLATDLKLRDFDYFSVGPDFSYDAYRKNLSHFTLGHGGYFSPERLIQLGVSSHFLTAEARQFIIKGNFSIGLFDKREAASPCFPTGGSLPVNPACAYAATSASGYYYSAQLMGVRRLSDHLQIGGAVVFRHSAQYDDKSLMVFVRYLFGPRKVVMSSDLPEGLLQSLY